MRREINALASRTDQNQTSDSEGLQNPAGHKSGLPDRTCWGTPKDLFDKLNAKCGPFVMDLAADSSNAKCHRYYSKDDDALSLDWPTDGILWLNPPYNELSRWMRKCVEQFARGCTIVVLLPAKTDTGWFHDFVKPYSCTEFLRGRVNFDPPPGATRSQNTTGSMVSVYGNMYFDAASVRERAAQFIAAGAA